MMVAIVTSTDATVMTAPLPAAVPRTRIAVARTVNLVPALIADAGERAREASGSRGYHAAAA
jgi:hypothetical protein